MVYVTAQEAKQKLFSNLVKLMPNATLYHFGILQSVVHMNWIKGVCGYKDFRPRYSTDIVYNNFPWPDVDEETRQKIEKTANGILKARSQFADCSIAELYDRTLMPEVLRKAHRDNDEIVLSAYGFKKSQSESEIIASLLQMYKLKASKV